ncbi:MAG: sigma-70 family RNA polymerase sigma factor [Planctomycetota bacterium]
MSAPDDQLSPESVRNSIARAKAGDAAALESVVERFYPTVERMVHQRLAQDLRAHRPWLASRFSTGDVVQEVFRSVLTSMQTVEGESEDDLAGYFAMVVRNRIIDAVRFHEAESRDVRQSRSPDEVATRRGVEPDPVESAAVADEIERLHATLQELEERERLLLRARLEGDGTFEELASRLGYSSSFAARRAYFAARAKLAVRLRSNEA